jgi:uncharacterized repeat protein (TIGR04138 family)
MPHPKLEEVVRRDPRYAYEAYEFVFAALAHTQKRLGKVPPPEGAPAAAGAEPTDYHVSGRDLLEGAKELALKEFGLMARTVFRLWGINATDDIGNIIFNLIDAELMSRTERDTREEFHAVFDLDDALVKGYRIALEEIDA